MRISEFANSQVMLGLLAVALSLSGCSSLNLENPGPVKTVSQTVEAADATSVSAKIDVNTQAVLTIHDGADSLLNAEFSYNESLKPDVSYSVKDALGELVVAQPNRRNLDNGKLRNEWDLQFGSGIPVDLALEVSSGNSKIDVSTMSLKSVDVDTSSGNLDATIGGNQGQLQRITAESSSGQIGLNLDGSFPALETIDVNESSGNVNLSLGGDFQSLQRMNMNSASGNTNVDLSGSWAHDLDASMDTSSGNVTLVLPTDVGVRINAHVSSGKIDAKGFRSDNGEYVNDAYGTSDVTLSFIVNVTSGNITLRLAD